MLWLSDSPCILQYCSSLSFFKYLNLVSATEVLEFQDLAKRKSNSGDCKHSMDQGSQKTCATLDYIYHIFDKYAVSSALYRGSIRDLTFHVLLKSKDTLGENDGQRKSEEYLKLLIEWLEKEKGKAFSNHRIQFQVLMSESWDSNGVDVLFPFLNLFTLLRCSLS